VAAAQHGDTSRDCFIIAPIGDRNAEIGTEERTVFEEGVQLWEQVIDPACREVGLTPVRADRIPSAGEIPEQVFRYLRDADIVIADVTGGNPNVMYELGLRHTKARATIQIGQRQRLPFDVAAIRTIIFPRTDGGLIEARRQLVEALRAAQEGRFDPVTATRLWNEAAPTESTFDSADEGTPEPEEEAPGFLELLVQMEEAVPLLSITLESLTALNADFVAAMQGVTEEVQASDAAGGGASQRLAIAIRFAQKVESFAEQFETFATQYEEQMRAADPGVNYILSELEADPEKLTEAGEFPDNVRSLGDQMNQMNETIDSSATLIGDFGRIARPLRKPSSRLAAALRRLASANVAASNWAARAERLPAPASGET
jgi:hypothetical protein